MLIHNKTGIRALTSMVSYTDKYRLEKIEAHLEKTHESIRDTIAVEVAPTVKGVVAAVQQVLVNRFVNSIDEISKQQDERPAAAIGLLEAPEILRKPSYNR